MKNDIPVFIEQKTKPKKFQVGRLTPFLRHSIGTAGKKGISFWGLLDKALLVNSLPTTGTRQEKFDRAISKANELGLETSTKRKQKKVEATLPAKKLFVSGVDVTSNEFLMTYEWRKARMVALKYYGPKCQCCGATPKHGAVINVDHIKPRRLFPELALDIDNLQILCHECNHGKGNWDQTDWRTS